MKKPGLKWERATPIYKPDNIISSNARAIGDLHGFKPKYETDNKYNFRFIMSNEYMRMWFHERDYYAKETISKQNMAKIDTSCKRRFVQKNMIPKTRERIVPIIQLKKFQNISHKVDDRQEGVTVCKRYQQTFEKKPAMLYVPACDPSKSKQSPDTTNKSNKKGTRTRGVGGDDDNNKDQEDSFLDPCK